jgi:VWFA-related protein
MTWAHALFGELIGKLSQPGPCKRQGEALVLLSAVLVLCGCGQLFAQQMPNTPSPGTGHDVPPATTVSVDVKAVSLLATVRDKHGKILSDLSKDDFTLAEDGRPVSVRYFLRETDLPLTLGLLVDTSMSQRTVLDQERVASGTFLEKVLREKDTAFLIHFDHEVELLQDMTSSRAKLEDAIGLLKTAEPQAEDQSSGGSSGQGGSGGGGNWPNGGHQHEHGQHHGGTQLYDAIYLASNELMKKQQGQKALIIMSDGVDRGSKESLESAVEAAQRADTLVYCILFKGEEPYGGDRGGFGHPGGGGWGGGGMGGHHRGAGGYPQEERPDGKKVLERIAKETGGHFFEASKRQPLDQIYSSIQEELRNQYDLGFTPDKADTAGYHKLLLKTKQNDNVVQTRDGFYLGPTAVD